QGAGEPPGCGRPARGLRWRRCLRRRRPPGRLPGARRRHPRSAAGGGRARPVQAAVPAGRHRRRRLRVGRRGHPRGPPAGRRRQDVLRGARGPEPRAPGELPAPVAAHLRHEAAGLRGSHRGPVQRGQWLPLRGAVLAGILGSPAPPGLRDGRCRCWVGHRDCRRL
ncbi:unnamed protein product, partial [Prorocentrum cordatum]